MPKSLANNVEIHYEVAGEGPALVLLHAIPFDHTLWLYQAARFSTWFRVISIDHRGWGRSAKVAAPFTFEDMCRDVLGVLDDERAEAAVVMGCSIGSKMALMLGGMAPERFRAVIQVGGNSGPQDFERRIRDYGTHPFTDYRRSHLRHGVREGFGDTRLGGYLLEMFSERDAWHAPGAVCQVFRALAAGDARPYLASYRPPTLIINGEFDGARPRGEATAKLIPGAEHRILPGTGHVCMLEDPAGFDALVIDFLETRGLMPAL